MRKCPPNRNRICPKCGKRKSWAARHCYNCSYVTKDRAKPGERRWDLIKLLGSGQSLKEIAFSFHVSLKTVEYHWALAKAEFGFECYQDVTRYAIKHNLITI